MICLLALLPSGLACGPAGAFGTAATPVDPQSATAFLSTIRLSDLSLAPDGSAALLTSNASGKPRPVLIDLGSGNARPAVADTGGTLRAVDWFPDGRRLLLSGDDQGDEQIHLFVAEIDGSVRDLTPGSQRRAEFLDWSDDGRSLYISDNRRDPGHADIYRLDASDFTQELLYRDTAALQFGSIAGDGRTIALLRPSGQTGGRIFIYDVDEERLTELPGQPDEAAAVPHAFSPDGADLYITSNEESDFARLERVNLDDGRRDVLFAPDWDVTDARLVPGGPWLLATVNEDARSKPYLVATDGSAANAVPVEPAMSVREVRVSGNGRRLAYLGSTGRTPTNLYTRQLSPLSEAEPAPTGSSRLLLSGLPPGLDPAGFVTPEIVRFPGLDSLPIPAILYRPHAASAERPAPFLLWAHGGPGGQAQIGFSPLIHYLVAHGYGVLEVNNRGSEGYGKRFWRLDDRRHGEADLDDYVAAKRWLGSLDWADSSRVAIAGSSYGGYLVLAALAFRPGTFEAGVDLYGISNWVRTIENMPPWFEPFRQALERELGPFDDLDAFRAKSPLFHADRIEEPLIVLQGANDPRVLQSESDEIVAALRERGVPVRYVLFDDEGHGFVRRENRLTAYRAIREFLDEHLAGGSSSGQPTAGGPHHQAAER